MRQDGRSGSGSAGAARARGGAGGSTARSRNPRDPVDVRRQARWKRGTRTDAYEKGRRGEQWRMKAVRRSVLGGDPFCKIIVVGLPGSRCRNPLVPGWDSPPDSRHLELRRSDRLDNDKAPQRNPLRRLGLRLVDLASSTGRRPEPPLGPSPPARKACAPLPGVVRGPLAVRGDAAGPARPQRPRLSVADATPCLPGVFATTVLRATGSGDAVPAPTQHRPVREVPAHPGGAARGPHPLRRPPNRMASRFSHLSSVAAKPHFVLRVAFFGE